METGVMDFEYPADKALSIKDVENQVEVAGYTPVSVSITRMDGTIEKTEVKEIVVANEEDLITLEFFAAGNCDMCRSRIEKAIKGVDGVQSASWDKETKQVTVRLLSTVSQGDLETEIASAGHDTNSAKADNDKYESLPGCCRYDREQ